MSLSNFFKLPVSSEVCSDGDGFSCQSASQGSYHDNIYLTTSVAAGRWSDGVTGVTTYSLSIAAGAMCMANAY